jgi:hypothetical protein
MATPLNRLRHPFAAMGKVDGRELGRSVEGPRDALLETVGSI